MQWLTQLAVSIWQSERVPEDYIGETADHLTA